MPITRSSRAEVSPEVPPSYHDLIGMALQATTFDMNKIGPDTKDTDIPWRLIKDLTDHFVSICPTLDTSGPEPSKYTITAHLRLGNDHNELQCGLKIDEWSKRAGPDGVEASWGPGPGLAASVTALYDIGYGYRIDKTTNDYEEGFTKGHVSMLTGAGMRVQEAMEGDRNDPEEVSDALRTGLSGKIPQILQAGGPPTLDYTCGHDTAKDGCYRLTIGTKDTSGLEMGRTELADTSIRVQCMPDEQLKVSVSISSGKGWSPDLSLGPEYEYNGKEVESRLDEAYHAVINSFREASQAAGDNMPDFSSYFLEQLNKKAAEISRSLDISPSTRNDILCRSSTIMKNGSRSGHISIRNIDLGCETKVELSANYDNDQGTWEPSVVVKRSASEA